MKEKYTVLFLDNVSRDHETLTKHMIEVLLVIGKCDNCKVQMERYTDPEPEIGGKMKSNGKRFDVMIESPTFRMIIEFLNTKALKRVPEIQISIN